MNVKMRKSNIIWKFGGLETAVQSSLQPIPDVTNPNQFDIDTDMV